MSAIRVLMVDDHPVDWEGLHTALDQANDVVVVGEARSGESAVEAAGKLTPDIVFMDARLPGMSWLDVTKAPKRFSGGAGMASTAMDYYRLLQMVANGGALSGRTAADADEIELGVAHPLHLWCRT